MKLPERLSYNWNAADIADDVIAIRETPRVFIESRGDVFPTTTLLRLLAYRAMKHSTFWMKDDEANEYPLQLSAVHSSGLVDMHITGIPRSIESFKVSSEPAPHTSMDGDVRFYLRNTTS